MPNKMLLLSAVAGVFIGVAVVKGTHAYFTDTATSAENTFQTATDFATPSGTFTPTPEVDHVVINEVNAIGGATVEWIELYNPTPVSVNLTGWSITDNNRSNIFPGNPSLPSHDFAVIIPQGSSVLPPVNAVTITLSESEIGNMLNPASDHVLLQNKANDTVDAVSFGGDHTYFVLPNIIGGTLQRTQDGLDTDTASDWHTVTATLGGPNQ